jgi:Response regulators consisting of a CheY-like receiver domain and a winged-helix DNA-binding domain
MRDNRPILLLEDDVVDHILVKRAFRDLNITNQLEIFPDGEAAILHLRDNRVGRPCIIILDLNMPRLSGIEFLKIIKEDEELRLIPVIVLTTSREEQDKAECFRLGVAGYMIKPVEYKEFIDLIDALSTYWTLSELPA